VVEEDQEQEYDSEYGDEIEEKIKEIKDQGVKIVAEKKKVDKK
jgi:predicted peroxiredoxin